jgi:hypothetical protein
VAQKIDLVIAYVNNKDTVWRNTIALDYYWRIYKKTKKKIKYLQDMGLEI